MATRFKRFRAYFPGRLRTSCAGGHSHFACVAVKVAIILFFGCAGLSLTLADARGNAFVEFDYNISSVTRSRSTVFVELYDDRPATTANFLTYVNGGFFNSSLMHRLVVNSGVPFALVGGSYYPQYIADPHTQLGQSLNPGLGVDLDGNYATGNPTIDSEFNNAPYRPNVKGTIAMDLPGDSNSASNQYFFNLNDNSAYLDFAKGGYTVFAKVAGDGMSLIDVFASQLAIRNMNPNGVSGAPFDVVPIKFDNNSFLPLIVNQAKVVDYLGSGIQTSVPAGGLTIANKDMFMDTGSTLSGTGTLTIGVGRTLGAREGFVITRPVINHGKLAPGLSIGVIGIYNDKVPGITTDYEQWFDGTLSIQLSGIEDVGAQYDGTKYDRLVINSQAKLAGKLQVSTLSGFTPVRGNSFTVLTAAQIIGGFNTYDLPQLASGQAWKIGASNTAITLTVVQGDYNLNGVVDANDYVVWRKTRNTSVTAYSGADGNGDGLVNDLDLAVWRSNLGAIGGGIHGTGADAGGLSTSNVPEPSSGLMILSAMLVFNALPRRQTTSA